MIEPRPRKACVCMHTRFHSARVCISCQTCSTINVYMFDKKLYANNAHAFYTSLPLKLHLICTVCACNIVKKYIHYSIYYNYKCINYNTSIYKCTTYTYILLNTQLYILYHWYVYMYMCFRYYNNYQHVL